jgi:hypothetical protein
MIRSTLLGSLVVLTAMFNVALANDLKPTSDCPVQAQTDQTKHVNSVVRITPTADVPCYDDTSSVLFNFGAFGGVNGDGYGGVTSQVQFPLSDSFAFQTEGVLGLESDGLFGQIAGHAFMHNDNIGMLGAYSSWSAYSGSENTLRIGLETDVNLGKIHISGVAGWQNNSNNGIFVDSRLGLAFTENTEVYFGYGYDNGGVAKLGFEHNLVTAEAAPAVTVYGQAQVFDQNKLSALLGVRLNFGAHKTPNCPRQSTQSTKLATQWGIAKKVKQLKAAPNPPNPPPPNPPPPNPPPIDPPPPVAQQCSALPQATLDSICSTLTGSDACSCGDYFGTYVGADYGSCGAGFISCN